MAGKYTPLENYLRDLPANQKEVALYFEQIERIINAKLPPSAYEYWAWWANEEEGNHVNARAWATAGWKQETGQAGSSMIAKVNAALHLSRRRLSGCPVFFRAVAVHWKNLPLLCLELSWPLKVTSSLPTFQATPNS